jgi:hypothetical protein
MEGWMDEGREGGREGEMQAYLVTCEGLMR